VGLRLPLHLGIFEKLMPNAIAAIVAFNFEDDKLEIRAKSTPQALEEVLVVPKAEVLIEDAIDLIAQKGLFLSNALKNKRNLLEKDFDESRIEVQALFEEKSKLKETMGNKISYLEASVTKKYKKQLGEGFYFVAFILPTETTRQESRRYLPFFSLLLYFHYIHVLTIVF
ncbi:hypothetical protein ACJX0J_028743, partial [Zea mays]